MFLLVFREDDRTILQACQKMGAKPETFQYIANSLQNKTADEVRLQTSSLNEREMVVLIECVCFRQGRLDCILYLGCSDSNFKVLSIHSLSHSVVRSFKFSFNCAVY